MRLGSDDAWTAIEDICDRLREKAEKEAEEAAGREVFAEVGDDVESDDGGEATETNSDLEVPFEAPTDAQLKGYSSFLEDTASSIAMDWKAYVNAAKFERQLEEKYGVLKPLVTHPVIERYVKALQRKAALGHFNVLKPTPLLPPSASLMVIVMLQRNGLGMMNTALAAAFLLGLQPWALVLALVLIFITAKQRKKAWMGDAASKARARAARVPAAQSGANSGDGVDGGPIGRSMQELRDHMRAGGRESSSDGSPDFDVVVLGSGPSVMFSAALLSKMGRRVLVLSESDCASGSLVRSIPGARLTASGQKVPFEMEDLRFGEFHKFKKLFQAAVGRTGTQEKAVLSFSRIGSPASGYAYDIVQCGGNARRKGNEGKNDGVMGGAAAGPGSRMEPQVVRSGADALVEDAIDLLDDNWQEESSLGEYIQACKDVAKDMDIFFLRKLLHESTLKLMDAMGGELGRGSFHECSIRYAGHIMNCFLPNANPSVRAFAAGLSFKNENILPKACSMAVHIASLSNCLDGMWYPIGGSKSVCKAFESVINQVGGKVVNLGREKVSSLLFDNGSNTVSCTGVKLSDGTEIKVGTVLSCLGIQRTYSDLIDEKNKETGGGLQFLSTRRPLIKVLLALEGGKEDLDLPTTDFWRLPSAARPIDSLVDAPQTPQQAGNGGNSTAANLSGEKKVKLGIIGGENQPPKFTPGESWLHVEFQSAKDPSWESRFGRDLSTCVVTLEADDDFVTRSRIESGHELEDDSTGWRVSLKGEASDPKVKKCLEEKVLADLFSLFPTLEGKVIFSEVSDVLPAGLSHTPARFTVRSVGPHSCYPGLYLGGGDITYDSFAGRMIAGTQSCNAILGYNALDLTLLEKDVLADVFDVADNAGMDKDVVQVGYELREVSNNDNDDKKVK